ncbi:MAG TPA: hypothetical protein VHF91_03485 [Acidimicrobiales bacterium]|nr:hypothetical protein [Acidimicrobiales bacterium]
MATLACAARRPRRTATGALRLVAGLAPAAGAQPAGTSPGQILPAAGASIAGSYIVLFRNGGRP